MSDRAPPGECIVRSRAFTRAVAGMCANGTVLSMRLFVVRHARAEERSDAQFPNDSQRPLTKQGIDEFTRLARRLERAWDAPAVVLASRFERAWQTARILRDEAKWPKAQRCEMLEADHAGGIAAVEQAILEHAGDSLAVVGHEPTLSELVSHLIGTDLPSVVMRKGAVAVLDVAMTLRGAGDVPGLYGSATLLALVDPRAIGIRERIRRRARNR